MNTQGDLFPSRPLHDAVRPGGNRDDTGARGELLHKLADAIQYTHPHVTVPINASAFQIWTATDHVIKTLLAEESFRNNHADALLYLESAARD